MVTAMKALGFRYDRQGKVLRYSLMEPSPLLVLWGFLLLRSSAERDGVQSIGVTILCTRSA